ncbi:MAG: helix-turn-helix domain-containing protein [Hyphomicrobiales bacterium]
MLRTFNRALEVADGLQSDFVRLLYYEFNDKFQDNYKSYESVRLCTILDGVKHVSINDGEQFSYDKNQLLLLPPHSTVYMDIERHTKALVLELNDKLITEIKHKTFVDEASEIDENKFFVGANSAEINNCLTRINTTAISPNRDKQYLLDTLARELTIYITRSSGARQILNNEANTISAKAIAMMREHLTPPVSIQYIAFTLNISVAFLSNKFKKEIGITPSTFYNNLKLQKAKNLLLNKNVNETSWELGFENVSHFIRLFTKVYGITPLQWKVQKQQ